MNTIRKVALAVNLNDPIPEILKIIKNLDFLNHCEIHLVHSFLTLHYSMGFGETALVYPVEADRKVLEESVLATLTGIEKKIFPPSFKGKVIARCLFSDDPKRKFCSYVQEEGIDLVIAAARNKRGFFESSFTQYVSKHTSAHMLVLKDR